MRSGLIVFHRHGHRAPAHNVQAAGQATADEVALWSQLLPSQARFAELNQQFPVSNHAANPQPRDLASHPFGILTNKGLHHLESVGQATARRFRSTPALKAPGAHLEVYATNYQRTQASGQAFLYGLDLHRRHNLSAGSTPMQVRFIEDCSMAYYEGRPALAQALIRRVQLTPVFRELEGQAEVQEAMRIVREALPGVAAGWPTDNKFNWMAIFDYFVCRRQHSLLNTVLPALLPLETLVCDHIAHRYELYYTDTVQSAYFCMPMLVDLDRSITKALTGEKTASLFVFSAHDVNILGLLFALQHPALAPGSSGSRYWPSYGTTLNFEVTQEGGQEAVVRATLDQTEGAWKEFTQGELRQVINGMRETIARTPIDIQ